MNGFGITCLVVAIANAYLAVFYRRRNPLWLRVSNLVCAIVMFGLALWIGGR